MHQPPPRRADGKLDITTIYLEMVAPPAGSLPPPPDGVSVQQAVAPTVSFYRYLYNSVGAAWLWGDRRRLSDAQLLAAITAPGVSVHVAYWRGVPAGYVELARRDAAAEIAYFGLLPEFIGRGLGSWLLRWAIRQAWSSRTRRVWVHTCTLDHPRALTVYQAAGFTIYDRQDETVDDPRYLGLIP